MITVTRYHDISCGHRVVGHESKCRFLHGHNYRIHFTARATQLDALGRVVDFGVIKSKLCEWLEQAWDHKLLLWRQDPLAQRRLPDSTALDVLLDSIVFVPFNPTAENMADYLLREIAPDLMSGTGAQVVSVTIDETRKCSATASLTSDDLFVADLGSAVRAAGTASIATFFGDADKPKP